MADAALSKSQQLIEHLMGLGLWDEEVDGRQVPISVAFPGLQSRSMSDLSEPETPSSYSATLHMSPVIESTEALERMKDFEDLGRRLADLEDQIRLMRGKPRYEGEKETKHCSGSQHSFSSTMSTQPPSSLPSSRASSSLVLPPGGGFANVGEAVQLGELRQALAKTLPESVGRKPAKMVQEPLRQVPKPCSGLVKTPAPVAAVGSAPVCAIRVEIPRQPAPVVHVTNVYNFVTRAH